MSPDVRLVRRLIFNTNGPYISAQQRGIHYTRRFSGRFSGRFLLAHRLLLLLLVIFLLPLIPGCEFHMMMREHEARTVVVRGVSGTFAGAKGPLILVWSFVATTVTNGARTVKEKVRRAAAVVVVSLFFFGGLACGVYVPCVCALVLVLVYSSCVRAVPLCTYHTCVYVERTNALPLVVLPTRRRTYEYSSWMRTYCLGSLQ